MVVCLTSYSAGLLVGPSIGGMKAVNGSVLRNRCSRGLLVLENTGFLLAIQKLTFHSKRVVPARNSIVLLM